MFLSIQETEEMARYSSDRNGNQNKHQRALSKPPIFSVVDDVGGLESAPPSLRIIRTSPLPSINKIHERSSCFHENSAGVIPGFPEEPFDPPFHNVVFGIVFRIDVAIVDLVPLIFGLLHVPALIHAFDSCDSAVVGLNMNGANWPS